MYLWCLLPSVTSAPPVGEGTSPDLATAMQVTEPWLACPLVFMLAIRELVPRISVEDLVPGWVPTGREWHARRARDDSARWTARQVPVDPDLVYFLRPPASGTEGPAPGSSACQDAPR